MYIRINLTSYKIIFWAHWFIALMFLWTVDDYFAPMSVQRQVSNFRYLYITQFLYQLFFYQYFIKNKLKL